MERSLQEITADVAELSNLLDENEEKQQAALSLKAGDPQYDEFYQHCTQQEDVTDAAESTRAVIEHMILKPLYDEEDDLTESVEKLENEMKSHGYKLESSILSEIAADVQKTEKTEEKIEGDRRIDEMLHRTPKRPIGASGFAGIHPTIDRSESDLDTIYENKKSKLQEEVHVLQQEDHVNIDEDGDTTKYFDEENDAHDNEQPIKVTTSGAIRDFFGRIDPILATKLLAHQIEAVKFVFEAFENGHGAVLALAMGMGKTLTTITIIDVISAHVDDCYILVLAPSVIVSNWEREVDTWKPPNVLLHPSISKMDRVAQRILQHAQRGGLIVTSLDTFRLHADHFGSPTIMVIDEGHRIKNNRTQLFAAVNKIDTPYKIALTGTPLQNNLSECHTLVQWIHPSLLGSIKQFQRCFGDDIESTDQDKMRKREHILKKHLEQVVFRRDNISELIPNKTEYRVAIDCSSISGTSSPSNSSLTISAYHDNITKCMPCKIPKICEMLAAIEKMGDQAVIFSGRTAMLTTLAGHMPGPVMIGTTNNDVRQDMIDDFQQSKECRIYISKDTGAQGINLTAGNHVIICDAAYNPTVEMQAVCRCWRIGQQKQVFVYRMIAANTMEDHIYKQQIEKFSLFSRIIDDKEIETLVTNTQTQLSLKKINIHEAENDSATVMCAISNTSNWPLLEITAHNFDNAENELSFVDKESAKNDFNVICNKTTRTLEDDTGHLTEVKPGDIFAGKRLVAPFPPVVSRPMMDVKGICLHPVVPAYSNVEIEMYEQLNESLTSIPTDDADKGLKNIRLVQCAEAGEYAFRVKGIVTEETNANETPWSEWSAFVCI